MAIIGDNRKRYGSVPRKSRKIFRRRLLASFLAAAVMLNLLPQRSYAMSSNREWGAEDIVGDEIFDDELFADETETATGDGAGGYEEADDTEEKARSVILEKQIDHTPKQ